MNYSSNFGQRRAIVGEPVRVLILGDRIGIQETIDQLSALGFCRRVEWSAIMPNPNGSNYMSIMTKWR